MKIIYGESEFVPLRPGIYKRTVEFFYKLKNDTINNPSSTVAYIFNTAIENNIHLLLHYKQLDSKFNNPDACYKFYVETFSETAVNKVRENGSIEKDNYYGTYLSINQHLIAPNFYSEILCLESEGLIITRYCTGSHNLKTQTGDTITLHAK